MTNIYFLNSQWRVAEKALASESNAGGPVKLMKWRKAVISGKHGHNWGRASCPCSWQLLLLVMTEGQNGGTGTGWEGAPTTAGIHSHLRYRIQRFGLWYRFLLLETWRKRLRTRGRVCPRDTGALQSDQQQKSPRTEVGHNSHARCLPSTSYTLSPPSIYFGCDLDGEERVEWDPCIQKKLLQGCRSQPVYILIDTTGLFSLDYLPAIITQHRDDFKRRPLACFAVAWVGRRHIRKLLR